MEWNIRNTSCSRSCDYGKNILSVNAIARNTSWNNLKFVTKRWLKKRAHWAVDKARYQNLLVLWTTFALNKTTRNLSGSIEFFVVLNSYRHKILTFCYARRSTNSCNNSGSAPLSVNTSISLFTDFSSFQDEIGISKFVGYSFYRHNFLLHTSLHPTRVFFYLLVKLIYLFKEGGAPPYASTTFGVFGYPTQRGKSSPARKTKRHRTICREQPHNAPIPRARRLIKKYNN